MKYKTRYAPSPTGNPHVGNIRSALFNYLAAKSTDGEFYLRIEDTDRERFVEGAIGYIEDSLNWLGIKPNGEVIYQSERTHIYKEHAEKLIKSGSAYKCFCSTERLAKVKEEQEAAKKPPVYDRCCLNLTQEQINLKERAGDKFVIRFKIPKIPAEISWNDKVRGKITIPTNTLEDFIIIKSDGWPTYNFANVIDDHEQEFNLVIRGDEFVPSTPKHILIYKAFGWNHPEFAHVPVIIGSDMKKLSKRNGDVALLGYKERGYLPEAMVNFLAFLGWNPGTTEEIFSLSGLEKVFSIDRVGKAPAVFDIERLNYLNALYIRNLSVPELTKRLIEFNSEYSQIDQKLLERVVSVEQTRIKTLAEFDEISSIYWELPKYEADTLVFKKSSPEATQKGLEAFYNKITGLSSTEWKTNSIENWNELLSNTVLENGLNNADVFWPVRVALSGLERSASPAELIWALGQEEALRRLKIAI